MKLRNLLRLLFTLTLFSSRPIAIAQTSVSSDTLSTRSNHRIGFDFRPNYLLPTHPTLKEGEYKKFNKQFYALHLKYAFRFNPDTYWGTLYPNTWQGIGVGYNAINDAKIGNPIAVYAFQHARIASITQNLSLNYEWNFGASFGWNPYHIEQNPENEIVGSKINAYINLGFMLDWQISNHWIASGGIGFSHFSNGNTHYPNAGLNSVEARISIARQFAPLSPLRKNRSMRQPATLFAPGFSYDIVAYGATRKQILKEEHCLIAGNFGIAGININPMYDLNKFVRLGVSLDIQYDESANIKDHVAGYNETGELRFYHPPLREQLSAGLSLRGELVMPIFSINFGMGHNVIYRGDDLKGFYQILVLKTHITHGLYLHTGYQLTALRTPKNLMLGLGYRFGGKRH